MTDLIDTTQMYLRTVVELEEEGITPKRARIAERLEQSSPTVSQTVARMERDGLLTLNDERVLELTAAGAEEGMRVMRRHRLAECFLLQTLELPLELVHEQACRWEHVMTEVVEQRLVRFLAEPTQSPYGNPIPGLDELGVAEAPARFLDGVVPVDVALGQGLREGAVRRLSENVQRSAEVLADVVAAGVVPGATIRFERAGADVRIVGPRGTVELGEGLPGSVYIARGAE